MSNSHASRTQEMPSQHQPRQNIPHPLGKTITFVLDGRTTLSEHLPSESINVPFSIITRSPRLHAVARQHTSDHPNAAIVPLPKIDPAGFKLFLDYLTSGYITFPSPSSALNTSHLSLRACIDLLYAHIVGGTLAEPNFQDYIIDEISRILSPKQSLDQKVLDVVFVDDMASEVLKKFVVDRMFAEDRKLVSMMRGGRDDAYPKNVESAGCEYHLHGRGGCYRKGSLSETRQWLQQSKPWSADEDPDLKAMAGYCLNRANATSSASRNNIYLSSSSGFIDSSQHLGQSRSVGHVPSFPNIFTMEKNKPLPLLPCSSSSDSSDSSAASLPSPVCSPSPHKTRRDNKSTDASMTLNQVELFRDPLAVKSEDFVDCLARLNPASCTVDIEHHGDYACFPQKTKAIPRRALPWQNNEPPSLRPGSSPESPWCPLFDSKSPAPFRSTTSSVMPSSNHERKSVTPLARPALEKAASCYLPPLVKRKAVPSRGNDWLEQQERLHMLQGTQGFELRRDERKKSASVWREIVEGVKRRSGSRPRSAAT